MIPAGISDTDKTLLALIDAGSTGVHSFELNHIVGTIRAAARVNDLKKKGYHITSVPEKMGGATGVRYFFSSSPPKSAHPKTKFIFDAIRQVYVEVTETINQPMQPIAPVQQSFL